MRTPSLTRRVVTVGMGVVVGLVLGLDVLLYLSVRSVANDRTEAAFKSHSALVTAVTGGDLAPNAEKLVGRFAGLGVEATVQAGDGPVVRSRPARSGGPTRLVSREVPVAGGLKVVLFEPAPDADPRLRRLLGFEAVITPLAIILAALLLRWIAEVAMSPLEEIAGAARRTTLGHRGERLLPDRPDTRLGQMAAAYDAMLDALEGAVAEARAAETESARQGERTRRVLETAGEAFIVTDSDGAVTEWNAEAERLLGWRREEVVGNDLEGTIIPPDQRPAHLTALDHFAEPTEESPSRARGLGTVAVRRDGERFPAEVTIWITTDDGTHTYNALLRDLTEQKRAEEATTRLATIVGAIDRAILSTDLDGTVLTWNPGAERMYGYTVAEAVGRNVASLIVPEPYLALFDSSLAAAAGGRVIENAEVARRRKDGTLIDVAITISPLRDATGAVYGASSLERDITEERQTASQLAASTAALQTALDEARLSEANTRRFLDDAAHQLRTPITSIRASAETLLRNITPDQRDRLLGAVVRDSERAGRLMAGLLRMARLGHPQALHLRPTDLLALCEEEADQARPDSPHLEITARAGAGAPLGHPEVAADAVAEIVANLVDNARRHARSRIEIVVGRDDAWVSLLVVDDGPGLRAGQTEMAFDRFVSLDAEGGSGLGLAIARELARAHGGDLTYGEGAFIVKLPWRPGAISDPGGGGKGPEEEPRAGTARGA